MIIFAKFRRPRHRVRASDALHTIADAAVPAWQALMQEAFSAARKMVEPMALRDAIDAGELTHVLEAVQRAWWRGGHEILQERIPALLGPLVMASAEVTFTDVARRIRQPMAKAASAITAELDISFTLDNPRIQAWLLRYSGTRIQDIDRATLDGLREVLSDALGQGSSTGNIVEMLRDAIGLRPDQLRTLVNYRSGLVEAGFRASRVRALVAQRTEELKATRALAIARTESLSAANGSQLLAWQSAANDGLLERSRTKRTWLPAFDACVKICASIPRLNPHGVSLDEPFQTPIGPIMAPAAHTN